MKSTGLQLEIVKNIDKKKKVCILPGEYLSPAEYIQDLINQLRKDIYPLFKVRGHALFTIARNTFCFIDHVSLLRYGANGNQTERIKKLIGEFAKYDSDKKLYINSKYKRYADYIVKIYRHDLVHNVRPFPHKFQIIDKTSNKSDGISWFYIASYIKDNTPKPRTFNKLAEYLKNIRNRSGLCHLRYRGNDIVINNYCLFFDFVNFLRDYKNLLSTDKNLQEEFAENYEKLVNQYCRIKDFILDKGKDKECRDIRITKPTTQNLAEGKIKIQNSKCKSQNYNHNIRKKNGKKRCLKFDFVRDTHHLELVI